MSKYHGWGRGGMVGVRKAIWRHDQTIRQAETILAEEHGTRHKEGEHELCPKCREHASKNVQSDAGNVQSDVQSDASQREEV